MPLLDGAGKGGRFGSRIGVGVGLQCAEGPAGLTLALTTPALLWLPAKATLLLLHNPSIKQEKFK